MTEQDDEQISNVRLLFDAYEPKEIRVVKIGLVEVRVMCAKDQRPGALQSGMWLWPAAETLCHFLLDKWDNTWTSLVEFGAGAGLASLFAGNFCHATTRSIHILITDRDFTSLKICRQSIKENNFGKNVIVKTRKLEFEEYLAGEETSAEKRIQANVAIGSDLIYSSEVVRSLMMTVRYGLAPHCPFFLVSSFRDPITTAILDVECQKLGLRREAQDYRGHILECFTVGIR